jgi:Fe-S-cluster containining protein
VNTGPWYREGLRFTCTRCGDCCTGFTGTVEVSDAEISALATRLELAEDEFRRRYTRRMSAGFVSLREKPNNDCVFWAEGHGCLVYEDRPTQCRTWPFWRSNVESVASWDDAAKHCPGMGKGRLYAIDEIEERADATP